MSEIANSRRAGLSAKPPVAEHGLHRPIRAKSFRDSATPQRRQAVAMTLGLALTLGVLPCGGAVSAGQSPVAIVVLEPQFMSGGGGEATAAAQLACDRLARELEKNASLRVVDRTQLDRVLKERQLGSGPAGTILSYDIMARLEVDAVRPVPRAILKLVDLSDGNLLAEMQFAWSVPLPDGAIRNMAGACQAAARRLAGPGEKAVRVRLLEVDNPAKSARLEPLAIRLREAVAGALARSEGVRPVHHLEALTAKEESLLLTLGLSKLPGGRQFTPQSDATIELRIREMDGIGKTFEQTRVEVSWRVRKGERYSGDWAGAEATVADFDKLVKDAWTRIAAEIGKVTPGAGNDFLNELTLRRRQAQAELDAAPEGYYLPREQGIKQLEHVAAAVKIDPTWEEPAYQLVHANLVDFEKPMGYGPPIREAARYLRRFPADRTHRTRVASDAFFWSSSRFLKLRYFPSTDPRDIEKLDADAREILDDLKQIVDTFAAAEAEDMPELLFVAMHIVYRAMAQSGVPADQRRQWMDRLVQLGSKNVSLATHLPEVHERNLLEVRVRLRMRAAGLLLAEGAGDQARKYLEELVPLLAASNMRKSDYPDFFREVEKLNDPNMLARLSAAAAETVWPLRINWLNMNALGMMPTTSPRPRANVTALSFTKYQGASPLAACGGRMYCIVPAEKSDDAPRIAYVDLDSHGRPAGKITPLSNQPPRPGPILATAVCDDKLYLGTRGAGLLEYDPAGGKWRAWGPDQGLPGSNVYTLVALDGGVLLCHGGDVRGKPGFLCHVKPATSETTLLRQLDPKVDVHLASSGLTPVWRAGDTIYGFIGGGAIYRLPGLGAGEPVRQPWPTPKSNDYYEAYPDGMAVVAGRRLLKCRDALREIDDEGKVLRAWPRSRAVRITSGPKDLTGQDVLFATDQPDLIDAQEYRCVGQDDSHIFFLDSWILCYDPAKETWYGPMETEPWTAGSSRAVSGPGGIWFQHHRSLIYLDTADFIAAAQKAGRVVTAEDFDKKRLAAINAAPPLDQAKWRLSLRQFDKARDQAAAVLVKDPTCAEALLIMGLVHEPCCLDQPDKALQYYARLAAMDNDPCVALAGLAHQYRVLFAAGRAVEALQVGRDIERRYPRNSFREALASHNRQLAKQIEGKSK